VTRADVSVVSGSVIVITPFPWYFAAHIAPHGAA
jgi:hypothetical protein